MHLHKGNILLHKGNILCILLINRVPFLTFLKSISYHQGYLRVFGVLFVCLFLFVMTAQSYAVGKMYVYSVHF